MANPSASTRIGGDLVLETLQALGAELVIGLPGQHALGLFDALRRVNIPYLGARVENNAGFMADGAARMSGTVTPLLLSTGPGALTSLAALQEAAASSIPVLAISAQIPVAGLGGGRHGYLHELPDQSASFRGVVKHVRTVRNIEQIVSGVEEAWRIAASVPQGPVLLEVPQDVLLEAADRIPKPTRRTLHLPQLAAPPEVIDYAASMLREAECPAILAGGGVARAGDAAQAALVDVAEWFDAPVVTTIGGKGTFPLDHPLSAGGFIEDIVTTELLENADVLLVIGSGLGELSSNYHTFAPTGRVIHLEADLGKLGANHKSTGIHADAALALPALAEAAKRDESNAGTKHGVERAQTLVRTVNERLDAQPLERERALLEAIRRATPDTVASCWDMTIAAYWAWSVWDPRGGEFASAQGAGGLGYGLPAAIGMAAAARVANETGPVLAVSGDGGALYSIAELAVLAQEQLPVVWLIVDDGGYGVLRSYMNATFGAATATELARPDYVALAKSFGIAAESVDAENVGDALARAYASGKPAVVVAATHLDLFEPTHLERLAEQSHRK